MIPLPGSWEPVKVVRRAVSIAILAAACGAPKPGGGGVPSVVLMDSVLLDEPDSLENFLPLRTQAMTADGELLLETGTAIVQFDRAGRLVRVMGRRGHGPGEFIRISSIGLLAGDSLLAAVDARRGRIVVFGLKDGGVRREVVLRAPFYPDQQWVVRGDTVVMPGKLDKQPFTTWITTTDSVWHWGSAPAIYGTSLAAYSQGGEPSIAPHDGGWLALFPADPSLYLLNREGEAVGRVVPPADRRLGVPSDVAAQVAAIAKTEGFHFAASLALAIRRLKSGQYLVVYLDADTELLPNVYDPSSGGIGVAYSNVRYWVTLLSPDLSRACVDGLVPLQVDNILAPFFRDDTLYFVARRVDGADHLRSVLYSYRIVEADCRWVPTGGVQALPTSQ